ncbi:MAG: NAD(P)-binding domain-containing protein [Acidobacteriota bacterium]
METLVSFLFAVLLTFFFVRRYLKRLAPAGKSVETGPAAAETVAINCPRCSKSLPAGSSFCSQCGAALAMWRVQQAAIQTTPVQSKTNQPRPVINTSICIGCGNCVRACDVEGTLQVINGKSILVHPERCLGHALCADACPTGALSLAYGAALQTIRVPRLNPNFETNIPGLYIAGELGGTGLIRTAINEGKLAVDDIIRRLKDIPTNGGGEILDLLIVGSGPAGLSASLSSHQHQLRYVTLEQGEIASTIRHFPRHKLVMAEPVDIPLYGSLYIGDGSKETLLAVWEAIIKSTGLCIQTHERVESVQKQDGSFVVQSSKQQYRARFVLLALGKQGVPRKLGVPGEESAKVLYRLIEAEGYSDSDILVVGGGDSALEAAVALSRINDNRVTLSYRGDTFKRARDRNRQKLEAHQATGKVNVLLGSEVAAIESETVRLRHSGSELELPNQFVFAMIGGESPEEFLRRSGVEIVEKVVSGP